MGVWRSVVGCPSSRSRVEDFESLLLLCDSVELLPQRQALEERIALLRPEMPIIYATAYRPGNTNGAACAGILSWIGARWVSAVTKPSSSRRCT